MGAPGVPRTYRLGAADFDSLGSGYGTESALALMRSAELSKRLLLLTAARHKGGLDDAAWSLLSAITGERPDIRGEVLGHPFVDAWASRYLRQAGGATLAGPDYLSGLAVAAAARAGTDAELTVGATTGDFFVPTVGLAYGLGAGPLSVRLRGGELTLAGTASTVTVPAPYTVDTPGWCATRRLSVGSADAPLTLAVEDLDPYRACFGLRVEPRLGPRRAAQLESIVDGAWRLVTSDHPDHAVAIRGTMRSLVPLATPEVGSVSGSAQTAFGAVATSIPETAAGLALLLVHETQHVKLGAVLDLVDLLRPSGNGLYHAPWRADPRPARPLFQGVYAHTGVADFWRVHRARTTGDERRMAEFEFAYWLAQTRLAARALAESDELTAEGERFVGHLIGTLDAWAHAPLDPGVASGVDDLMTAVSVRWRLDNHRPPASAAADLATAWNTGRPCPALDPPAVAPAEAGGPPSLDGIAAQIRARFTATTSPAAGPGEEALLEGRVADAVEVYRAAATAVPDDPLAWIGLAVALGRHGDLDAARALVERPELVRAAFARLREAGAQPAPDVIARWLAPALS